MNKSDAIEYYGSATELSRVLSATIWPATPQAISQWPEQIPEGRAYQIEVLSGGALYAEDES